MLARFAAIVFDRDGTLFDSLPLILRAFNHSIEPYTDKRPTDAEWFAEFGPDEPEVIAAFVGEERKEEAYQRFYRYYKEHSSEITLFEGIREFLHRLHAAGVKIGMFTGGGLESTIFCLKQHNLLSLFGELITGDRVAHPKPDPEGVLLATGGLNVRPEDTLVVGDAGSDVIAAQKAGAKGGLARWSRFVPPHDLACEPDFLFRTVKEMEQAAF